MVRYKILQIIILIKASFLFKSVECSGYDNVMQCPNFKWPNDTLNPLTGI